MDFWKLVLCALLVAVLGGLYLLGTLRRRRPKEPPLDKGYIPWIGYGLHLRKNEMGFLQKMQKKHGDIFTVLAGGEYFTFVMDPHSFGAIVKAARDKLDFTKYAEELVTKVFGFPPTQNTHKVIETASGRHLKGSGLEVMTQAMLDGLHAVMLPDLRATEGERAWKQDGLFHYSYNMVFRAGYLALFGTETNSSENGKESAKQRDLIHSEEIFGEFRKFDQFFPRFATSMLSGGQKKEVENLKQLFWDLMAVKKIYQRDNISRWVSDQEQALAEEGMPENMRDRFLFMLLWAAQGNTGPASFWLLAYLMKNPKAMEEVRKEVNNMISETGQEVKAGEPVIQVTRDMLSKMPVLESAVSETLRLAAAPMLLRAVLENVELKMSDGREYTLRKGDRVAVFPYLSLHMDPEIHPEPRAFQYDRFLTQDGTKKEFYKNGEKLKYYTMPWGAGTSICPGRFFAVNEMKLFAFLMLTYFDMELVNQDEEIPPIDESRYGFGVMQPTHDIQFKYRLRY